MQTTYRHDKSYLVMIKNKEQVLNLLGIARRARQLQSGEEIVLKNIQTKKARTVFCVMQSGFARKFEELLTMR